MHERVEHIGNATLYLGNSLEVLPTIDPADHMIFDPPYEAAMQARMNSVAGGKRKRADGGTPTKALDFDPIDDIRDQVVELTRAKCSGWVIAFCTPEGVRPWQDAMLAPVSEQDRKPRIKYRRACAWVKPDAMPQLNGMCPAPGFECFVCGWAGAGKSVWNGGGKKGVYTHLANFAHRHGKHPTEKPLFLMSEIVTDFTKRDQLICDPFMGSGTTGVAALMAGRRFIGVEKNPEFFEIACKRIRDADNQSVFMLEDAAA